MPQFSLSMFIQASKGFHCSVCLYLCGWSNIYFWEFIHFYIIFLHGYSTLSIIFLIHSSFVGILKSCQYLAYMIPAAVSIIIVGSISFIMPSDLFGVWENQWKWKAALQMGCCAPPPLSHRVTADGVVHFLFPLLPTASIWSARLEYRGGLLC